MRKEMRLKPLCSIIMLDDLSSFANLKKCFKVPDAYWGSDMRYARQRCMYKGHNVMKREEKVQGGCSYTLYSERCYGFSHLKSFRI